MLGTDKMDLFDTTAKKIVPVTSKVRAIVGEDKIVELLDTLFEESYNLLWALFDLKDALDRFKVSDADPFDLVDEEINTFEAFIAEVNIESLEFFDNALAASKQSIQRRLLRTVSAVKTLTKVLGDCVVDYISLNDNEIDNIEFIVDTAIKHLVFFIYYQFDVDKTYSDFYDSEMGIDNKVQVSSSIEVFCKNNITEGKTVTDMILEIVLGLQEIYLENKPEIPALMDDPDLLNQFEEAIGSSIVDIADIAEKITKSVAIQIISGEKEVDELLDEFEVI